MNVKILETGKIEQLRIIDRKSGVDYAGDLIGNAGDDNFGWCDEDDIRTCEQSTYEWWAEYLRATERAHEREADLCEEYDSEIVRQIVMDACDGVEFSDIPAAIMSALDTFTDQQTINN